MKESQGKKQSVLEKEDAYKSLETIIGWIGNIDSKASFLLAYLAVLIGFAASNGKPSVFSTPNPTPAGVGLFFKVFCVIMLYCALLISVVLLFSTLTARIKNKEGKSLLFFGTIAALPWNDFKSRILNRNEDDLIKDILEQIHINAGICTKKSKLYNAGVKTTFLATVLYVLCVAMSVF